MRLLVGELSTLQKASLPIAGALGGMVAPAIIYAIFNAGGEGARGWGIPMATDIAFVVGIMALSRSTAFRLSIENFYSLHLPLQMISAL